MHHWAFLAGSAALLLAMGGGSSSANSAPATDDLTAVARDSYVFTFPLYEMYRIRYLALCSPLNPRRAVPNTFRHRRELADATSRAVTAPNADTLYSSAFLDLSQGPLLLQVPAIADRYYSLAFMDFYTNDFAYVGTRATGSGAGQYLIAGPNWTGSSLPPEINGVIHAPTSAVWLLGRFAVAGPQDLPAVHREQDELQLSPYDAGGLPPRSCTGPPVDPGALRGLAALTASEAMYLNYVGERLSGDRHYRLHFAAGNLPPADAFWSLSAYEVMPDKRSFFAANPIGRYSIGDKTPGLRRNPDGSLDILIQHDTPGTAGASNWLPAPAGPFALSLRAYLPRGPLRDGSYAPPALEAAR
jgi:hypothetical protein